MILRDSFAGSDPEPTPASPLVEAARTTRFVEVGAHTVLVSRSICSVLGDSWAWTWVEAEPLLDGTYVPVEPVVRDWTDAAEVRRAAELVVAAYHRACRSSGQACRVCGNGQAAR